MTYIPGDFEITRLTGLTLNAEGFVGVYDGQEHAVHPTMSTSPYPEDNGNTVVEYSVDGGKTWTIEVPSLTNVGEVTVPVRATNPNYETVQVQALLKITPRQVTVGDCSKISGDEDPEFTAAVVGLLDGDKIVYSISREPGEAPRHLRRHTLGRYGAGKLRDGVRGRQAGDHQQSEALSHANPGSRSDPRIRRDPRSRRQPQDQRGARGDAERRRLEREQAARNGKKRIKPWDPLAVGKGVLFCIQKIS